ncbi:VOC family protein [Mycolicibacterium confluentis]|uniref:Lactoylglutathione lyase n=1 Tax=Mycolicibacterium confluentis TaxID=28047 RepID=A0A7I7XW40_9MYCO|nr:VOC family protein [Mycolicibacterium confluentis]MCV7321648.1 VOC family protein [Mycolicibacterium confluentis]ORV31939.1 lactoylglutathione lyase [Mycolicibacterium confluentis]BBZ33457.1 lactoylglutathione lyase [Mycolicibacterium confluentis]
MSTSVRTPVQIAWVTRDLDATETALTALLGARKWVRMPDVHFGPESCTYRGAPADYVADISLSYVGDMQVELIRPVRGDNIYDDFLRAGGTGLHHICITADDPVAFAAALAQAEAEGAEVVTRGVMPGGMEFAYVSAPDAGVPYIEIAYIPDEIKSFFDYIKQEQV